jgi:anti-sigma regulatory factor (Ser/Thr protein kinase)
VEVSRLFSGEARSLVAARRFADDALREWGCGRALIDDVMLVVSELAANVVVHVDADYTVRLVCDHHRVRVIVEDESLDLPRLRNPSPTTLDGRGLQVVTALATDWGVEVWAAGKLVWADLPLHVP